MHNGFIDGFHAMKRDLALAVDPDRFADIEGTTDSEMLLFLALTFGLDRTRRQRWPGPSAWSRRPRAAMASGSRCRERSPPPTAATTWAFRYSSEGRSRTLFHSTDVSMLRQQYPENPALHELSDDARLVVSEPLGELRGAWREVPEASCLAIHAGEEKITPFKPLVPAGIG